MEIILKTETKYDVIKNLLSETDTLDWGSGPAEFKYMWNQNQIEI